MMEKIFDIAICGAGPVGQALALFLLKRGLAPERIALIDAKTLAQAQADQRTIALSYGSRQLLQSIDAAPRKATAIEQIHVSRTGHFGRTLIDRNRYHVAALGYVARYADIIAPLSGALETRAAGLSFLRPVKVIEISQSADHAQIRLDDQRVLQAQIVVQAEGGLFDEQSAHGLRHDYRQTALIATIKTSRPIAARAYERFTDHGPLALLPQEDGYALVWCVTPEMAERLMQLDDAHFLSALQPAFGNRLGQFIHATPRAAFALGLNAQTAAPTGRVICIGNAAQTLHPVAGQGLNLGLRDAFQLSQALSRAPSPQALQDFFTGRAPDRNRTIQLTDKLAKLFTRGAADAADAMRGNLIQSALGLGLGAIDIILPAQKWLADQMMFGKR